jgi:TRAP transporter 4TM/12TM fusion protein
MEWKQLLSKKGLITLTAVGMCIFHMYTAQFGLFSAIVQRSIHLLFACILIYLTASIVTDKGKAAMSTGKKVLGWSVDIALILLSFATLIYLVVEYKNLVLRGGEATDLDLIFGAILIVIVLDITKRTIGWALPIITLIAIAYSFWGHFIPGGWGHRPIGFEQFVSFQYLTTEGLFSIPLGVSASFIFIFVLFAAFLLNSGVGLFFINFANGIAGGWRGGPAKVAIITSGFFGMISGSAVANVASVGSFTIPLMKKLGYSSTMAGAVEAVASTGGQIMPPIMGAAAFIVAEMCGVSYLTVCIAAAIPAVLYYFSLFYIVHLEAIKVGMVGTPKEELPSVKEELLKRGYLILPAVLLVAILILGYSPMKAGFWSILAVYAVSLFKKETRMGWTKIKDSLVAGSLGALQVVSCCACAGIVIGIVTQTGLGLKFSNLVVSAAHGNLILSLSFIALAALVLGMGLTTSAAYILTVIIAAPALMDLGVELLTAHLFVFYYACLSTITPPVALASYAAAGIAGASPFRVGYRGMALAIVAYIVPFFFIYNPSLLWRGPFWLVLVSFVTAVIGCMAIGSAVEGHLLRKISWIERLILLGSGLFLIAQGIRESLIGLAAFLVVLGFRYALVKRAKEKVDPAVSTP